MSEKETQSVPYKTILIGVACIGLIGLGALILWPRPCDGIFQQTAPKVEANLKIIENEGAFAVSRAQIQKLSESAQKVGLHLKTCCTVLDGGKLDSTQFQQCIDNASGYEKHLGRVAQQVKETIKAKNSGATEIVEAKKSDINQAIETATSNAESFVTEQVTPPPLPLPKSKGSDEEDKEAKEKESNDQIREANEIQLGTRIQGTLDSREDRDYFKFRTSDREPSQTRIILRKLMTGGFYARIDVYDQVENRVTKGRESGNDAISITFESIPNSDYYILVTVFTGDPGPYELEVREE